jgi:shikimate dehydrogenase
MDEHRYLVGLVGSGVGPSLTPQLHMRAADRLGIGYIYRTIDLDQLGLAPERIGDVLDMAQAMGYDALNITHPVKTLVIPCLDKLDRRAEELGTVNTVLFRDGKRVGHNTDWTGFATSFRLGLPDAKVNSVVLIGAGGAGMSIGHALLTAGVLHLHIVDVREDRARTLAERLGGLFTAATVTAHRPDELSRLTVDGFVHCTPTGMAAHPGVPFDTSLLEARHWVADIVYRPLHTQLLKDAEAAGCRTLDGSGMTVYQAVEAFTLITGTEPQSSLMKADFVELVTG